MVGYSDVCIMFGFIEGFAKGYAKGYVKELAKKLNCDVLELKDLEEVIFKSKMKELEEMDEEEFDKIYKHEE